MHVLRKSWKGCGGWGGGRSASRSGSGSTAAAAADAAAAAAVAAAGAAAAAAVVAAAVQEQTGTNRHQWVEITASGKGNQREPATSCLVHSLRMVGAWFTHSDGYMVVLWGECGSPGGECHGPVG